MTINREITIVDQLMCPINDMETDCVMMFVIAGTANSSSYGSRSEFWGPVRYKFHVGEYD